MLEALIGERSLGRSEEATPAAPIENGDKALGPDAGFASAADAGVTPALQETLDKVNGMIKAARSLGADAAADNLEYWLAGKGGLKSMPSSAFAEVEFIAEHLRFNHRSSFQLGAQKRLKGRADSLFPPIPLQMLGGEKTVSPAPNDLLLKGEATLYFEDSLVAPGDHQLMFALGGFTLHSEVVLQAVPIAPENGGGWTVSFKSWKARIYDMYNWDNGKSTAIPGFGDVEDAELARLEQAGYGKSFKILSEQWDVTDASALDSFRVAP